jgi:hypothetical protein
MMADGATWSLTSRGKSMIIYCCHHCSAWHPELSQLEVTEGELVTVISPFSQVRDNEYKQLDIDIVVVDVWQDLMSGKIKFHGSGDLVSFDVIVQGPVSPV